MAPHNCLENEDCLNPHKRDFLVESALLLCQTIRTTSSWRNQMTGDSHDDDYNAVCEFKAGTQDFLSYLVGKHDSFEKYLNQARKGIEPLCLYFLNPPACKRHGWVHQRKAPEAALTTLDSVPEELSKENPKDTESEHNETVYYTPNTSLADDSLTADPAVGRKDDEKFKPPHAPCNSPSNNF